MNALQPIRRSALGALLIVLCLRFIPRDAPRVQAPQARFDFVGKAVGTLAEVLSIHPSTATRLCDRLVRKRLIDRHVSTESRREVTVDVTVAASTLLAAVTERRRTEIQSIVHAMDHDERQRLIKAFDSLAKAAGELPDDAWKLGWS